MCIKPPLPAYHQEGLSYFYQLAVTRYVILVDRVLLAADPARSGMSAELNSFLQQSGARKIVYVSCNPATQARDVAQLCRQDSAQYRLTAIQPCDMFPNTAHIECIAVMEQI